MAAHVSPVADQVLTPAGLLTSQLEHVAGEHLRCGSLHTARKNCAPDPDESCTTMSCGQFISDVMSYVMSG